MTSKLTREKAQWLHDACEEAAAAGIKLTMNPNELLMFTSYALAAIDSKPVCFVSERNLANLTKHQVSVYVKAEPIMVRPVALYRHAQQPVVPDDVLDALQKVARIRLDLNDFDGDRRGIADCLCDAEEALIEVVNRRAAMLQAGNYRENANSSTNNCREIAETSTNSPVIGIDPASGPDCSVEVRYVAPPGYVMVPKDLISELRDWAHPEIEKHCEMWEGRRNSEFPALRKVIADADALLAADPQPQNAQQNIPEIIPGWIPLSEKMPPSRHEVLVGCWWGEKPRWCCKWATYIPGHPDAQSSGWLIPGGSWTPTHWMELPAGPKEVKGES